LDGVLYVADVNAADQTLTNVQQILVGNLANLEEVIFDLAGQNVYTADQDIGGIFGFSIAGGTRTPLLGSPWPEARRKLFSEGGSAKTADPPGIIACAVFPILIGN